MKELYKSLSPYLKIMAVGISIKFIGAFADLFLPWILSYMIDDIVPMKNMNLIFLWGGIMILCAAMGLITNIVANRMAARVASHTTEDLRHRLFSKILSLSSSQIDYFTLPSLELRLTSDTYHVNRMVSMIQRMGIRAPILLLGGIVISLTLEPVLAGILILTLPFLAFLVFFISKKGIPMYTALQKGTDKMIRIVRENISGVRIIKALSKETIEKKRFEKSNQEVVSLEKKVGMTMALTNPMMNLLLNIGLSAVIFVGAIWVNSGVTQPGKIIAFLSYFTIVLNAMMSITRMFVMLTKGIASAGRIQEVLSAPLDLLVEDKKKTEEEAHIVFDHVSFSYQKKENNLEDIHFSLKQGETLGIIGATGSGKSTILSLLMRFYDVDKGEIRIHGVPLQSIPKDKLYQMFGVVFQNDFLIAQSIRENIAFGRQISDEKLLEAMHDAQADEFVFQLEKGLDHELSARGANISGGQKQRLLISRALAGSLEILILDDSSSALDYATDARLRHALQAHYQHVTTILVAQRVSSIQHADHILVLKEGREIGYGTHEELMETCDSYAQIAKNQMGGAANGQ